MSLALVGNPNSGKTTLFNALTGKRQHVGNWPGVTVEIKEGSIHYRGHRIPITDLPGIYSLEPDTTEQVIAKKHLDSAPIELIINIVDAGNLERSLYLTLQLLQLKKPMVLALNMTDELEKKGSEIDTEKLSFLLGIPVVSISAAKGENLGKLMQVIHKAADGKAVPPDMPGLCTGCSGCTHAQKAYRHIESIVASVLTREPTAAQKDITRRLDRVLLNRWLAFPMFLLIMTGVFALTFGATGWLSDLIDSLLSKTLAPAVGSLIGASGAPAWVSGLITGGIIPGVGSVLSFLPQIAVLFILTSLLEDSGYMSRAAFIMDKGFAKLGLGGGAFMPMLLGFGCTVPAVMACRSLPTEKERRLAIMLVPFMSCSARMPVYVLLAGAFFGRYGWLTVTAVYFMGIAVAALSALLFNKILFKNRQTPFIMEIPPYRLPSARNLVMHSWEKIRGFLTKAGTVLLAASVIIWVLQYFTPAFSAAASPADSLLAWLGRGISPVFSPIGLGDWRASVALLSGVAAKEAIVSTLGVLSGAGASGIGQALQGMFSPLQAFVMMAFTLLYMPCAAAIAAIRKEMHSWKWTALTLIYGLAAAYLLSLIIYYAGKLFGS
jgi:ferrous iron transport protein B